MAERYSLPQWLTVTYVLPDAVKACITETVKNALGKVTSPIFTKLPEGETMTRRQLEAILRSNLPITKQVLAYLNSIIEQSNLAPIEANRVWMVAVAQDHSMMGRINARGRIVLYPPNRRPHIRRLSAEEGFGVAPQKDFYH